MSRCRTSYLAQFSWGVLPIKIEYGRSHNIPLDDRLCELCENNETIPTFCCNVLTVMTYGANNMMGLFLKCGNFNGATIEEKLLVLLSSDLAHACPKFY